MNQWRMIATYRTIQVIFLGVILVVSSPAQAQEAAPGAGPSAEARTKATVDPKGFPLTDPSENVRAVLEAGMKALADIIGKEVKRADDLRAAVEKIAQTETKRIDEIIVLNAKHEARMADVIREFNKDKSEAESRRIDAFRASDAAATKEAQQLALTSIKELTSQALAASKDATAKQENAADKRFEQQRSEWAVQIKSFDEKLALVTSQNNTSAGRDAGTSAMWAAGGIILTLLLGAAALLTRRPPPVAQHYTPYNYYPPPPPQNGSNGPTYNYAQSSPPPH